jgi:LPXTG-motif cell wall-anchored protein
LAILSLLTPSLALARTLTGTFLGTGIGREVAYQYKGEARSNWAGTLKFKFDDGPEVAVFCIEIEVRVRAGDRYKSDGPVLALPNGCQIRYLLDKYPANTAGDADEAAARQMAIWVFSDNLDPLLIEDARIRDRTIALVNEARLGACPDRRTSAPDLTLDPPVASASAGQTVGYTVSAGAQDAGQTLSVSISGPGVLTDASGAGSGQQRQNVTLDGQGQAKFWVTGTGPGQMTVRVDLTYLLEAGTVFSHLDDNAPSQRLVMAENRALAAGATAQVVWAASAPLPTAAPTSPPQPTERPSRPDRPTDTPDTPEQPQPTEQPAEQPTTEAVSGEQPTAVSAATPADTAGMPVAAPDQSGQVPPADQSAAAPAGGAPRPASLPNTAAPGDAPSWLIVAGIGLIGFGGWLLARRKAR